MVTAAHALRPRIPVAAATTVAASVAAAWLVVAGYPLETLGALTICAAAALGVAHWRRALLGLLLYLPVSGIAIVAMHPNTVPAVLAKDFLFVLPAYLGFAAYAVRARIRIAFPGAPTILFVLLGALVLAQAVNPDVPNALVAEIGLKVWLLYMPMYFLGFHFIRTRADLGLLLRVMALAAIVPVVVGIAEAAFIYAGSPETVYRFYGDAAAAVTQNFAALGYPDGGALRRVPSTFSFVTQYYAYLATMVAIAYAWWRFVPSDRRSRAWRAVLFAAILIAVFLSGARVAFLFVPLLVLVMLALDRQLGRVGPAVFAGIGGAFITAAIVIGTTAAGAVAQTFAVAKAEFKGVFVDGFVHAFETTWLGLGTGTDTNATRYAFAENSVGGGGGYWYESWHVKVVLELGVPGVVLVALLLGTIVVRGLRAHRVLRDRSTRAVSAAILAFLIVNIVAGVKGQYLDFDPVNVYFWLLAGVLAKLPFLDDRSLAVEAAR